MRGIKIIKIMFMILIKLSSGDWQKQLEGKKDTRFNLAGRGQRVKTPRIPPRCPEAPSTLHIGLRYKSCRKRDGGQVRDCAGDEAL